MKINFIKLTQEDGSEFYLNLKRYVLFSIWQHNDISTIYTSDGTFEVREKAADIVRDIIARDYEDMD